ncbi:hypothetical protein SKAU_G00315700 [Synaphobranchus kaupii]|uniref:VWFD domain-containing protein n=1 Tax=Synaphobranchus kaupii TaxID=118154 RepID=A0A9Q1ESI6_SYNKA|nr:hypothetical protein SKAU_G00315700 [Synaphobranchus kaupii]
MPIFLCQLELDSKYQNRTCGLCGDFNGIPLHFEFLEGGRQISSIEFGNRQKVHLPTEYCEDPSEEEEEFEDSGLDKCSKFVLSPEPYIQACMQDMCSCGDLPDDFCICSTLTEYSRQCSHAGGAPPNWRSPNFCAKKCPLNMVYSESGSPCMNTCSHTDTSLLCEEHLMDGCVCPEGLCGNFNMVLHDDLKTPQGLVEGTAASFANSWKAQASCPNRMERLDDPCSLSVENENYAEYWCSLLQNRKSEFSKCHTMVNPEAYYRRCKYSSCNCEKSEDCLCAVFSSYVRACQDKGVELQDWRTNVCGRYTETCPASQTFSYQLQQCQRTCRSLGSDRPSCSTDFLPVDGCSCPDGLYQDERGVCVTMAKCHCYHNGDHVKPGKSITIKEEHCMPASEGLLQLHLSRAE